MLVTKDSLLAELARALKSKHADSADQMLAVLEPAITDGSPHDKPSKKKDAPKKLSGAVPKYAEQAAEALVAAFPDHGADLAEQLRMQVALGRIERWLAINRADYHAEMKPGATEKDIAALEKKTNLKLPIAMHAFFRWHNGAEGYSSFYMNNTMMDCEGAASSWQIMHDLIPQFENDDGHANWWKDGWLSFLENGGGDSIVLDLEGTFTGKKGQLLEFWHDDSPRTVLFPDLMTWAEVFAESLEKGMWEGEDDFELSDDAAFKKLVGAHAKGYPKEFDADEE